jgi:hypothetical protein
MGPHILQYTMSSQLLSFRIKHTMEPLPFGSSAARLLLLCAGTLLCLATMIGGFVGSYIEGAPGYDAYAWLASNWMFVHAAVGGVVLLPMISDAAPSSCDWLTMLLSAVYTSHQWEEHAWDVFGRRFPFVFHLANILKCDMALETKPLLKATGNCGVDQNVILWINVYGVMGMFLLPIIMPPRVKPAATLLNAMIVAINAILFHIIAGAKFGHYNPGLVQSILINAPLGLWVIHRLVSRGLVSRAQVFYAFLLVGVPGQLMFAVGPMIAANKGYLGYAAQHAVQLCLQLGVIPGAAFLLAGGVPSKAAKAT